MELLISHKSALEYWRLHGLAQVDTEHRQRRKTVPSDTPTDLELQRMDARGLSFPFEITVGSLSSLRRLKKVRRTHVSSEPLPEGSIFDVGGGLFVASPELCFFQLASRLPLAKLLRLGLEICGTYSLPANEAAYAEHEIKEKGFKNRPALSSVERLSSFLARSRGQLDQRQLTSVLHYIANGSASPMESKLLILLALPYRHGGFGLPLPELDALVEPGRAVKKLSDKKESNRSSSGIKDYRCDFYWRELKLAVEYDSDSYHLLSKQKADDSKKKNYLLSRGIQVITVSKLQMQSVMETERVAHQIAARHGRRLKYKNSLEWSGKHLQLRRQLSI